MNRSRAAWLFILVAILIAHAFSPSVLAAFAPHVNYQGKLADETGTPVLDDLYNMEFILYDDPTGGSAVWTETLTGANRVSVTDGLFSVLLGEVTPFDIPDLNQPLYLSVNIGGTSTPAWDGEMMPRRQLSTAPSAFLASVALSLDATNATSTNATTTSLYVSGGLGVGTSTPASSMLAINGSASKTNIFEISSSTNANILTVTGTGNVGIGTSSPSEELSVTGDAIFTGNLQFANWESPNGLQTFTFDNNDDITGVSNFSGSSLSLAAVNCRITGGEQLCSKDFKISFTDNAAWSSGTRDIGIARDSAGVLRITNGSTGGGALKADFFTGTSTVATNTFGNLTISGSTITNPTIDGHINLVPNGTGEVRTGDIIRLSGPGIQRTGNYLMMGQIGLAPVIIGGSSSSGATGLFLSSTGGVEWTSGGVSTAGDTGLERLSAGIVRITDGASGGGALYANYFNATSTTATSTFAGAVGIGTTTPEYVLHVVDNAAEGTSFAISDGVSENRVFTVDALNHGLQAGDVDNAVNGTRFSLIDGLNQFIFENGRVGINTTTPQADLVVKNFAGVANIFELASSASANILRVTATGLIDAGGGLSFELPNGTAPTVNIFGQLAADSNILGTRGAMMFFDGTAATVIPGILATDTCTDNQIPKFDDDTDTWTCETDETSAGAGISTIEENNSSVTTGASRLDFLGADFTVATDGGAAEADVSIDYTNSGITRKTQNETITGDWAFTMAGTESLNLTSDLAGSVDVLSIIGTPSGSAGTARGLVVQQADSANAQPLDVGILIDNADTNLALVDGLLVTSAAGLITDAIDVSDAEIDNALKAGTNFLAFDGLRIFEGTTGTMTIEDSSGNDVITLVDDGTTGSIVVTGTTTVSGMGINFIDSDTNPGCGAGDYKVYADTSEGKLKKCVNGVVSDIQAIPDVQTFADTTFGAATWTDANTVSLFTDSPIPNITPKSSTSEVLIMVSIRGTANPGSATADTNPVARVDYEAGVTSDCADTNNIGGTFGTTVNDVSGVNVFTINNIFVHAPATTAKVEYAICNSADSLALAVAATAVRTDVTLMEINSVAADLAEIYPTNDDTLAAGEVVSGDPMLGVGVERSQGAYDKAILGVVSTNPALVIGSTEGIGITGKPIALSGRVPVKVTIENGPIKQGDVLVAGNTPGTAMKATKAGTMLGIALEAFDGEGVGSVMAFVKTGSYTGSNLREILTSTDVDTTSPALVQSEIGRATLNYFMEHKDDVASAVDISEILTDRLAAGLEIVTPTLIADTVEVAHLLSTNPDGAITFGALNEGSGSTTSIPAITFDANGNAFFAGTVSAGGFTLEDTPFTPSSSNDSIGTSTEALLGLLFGSPEILDLSDRIGNIETTASTTDAALGTLGNTTATVASTTEELARRVNEIETALSQSAGLTLNTEASSTTGADENLTEDTDTFLEEIEDRVATAVEILADLFIGGLDGESLVARSISAFSLYARNIFADTITIIPDGRIIVPAGQDQISGTSLLPAGATEIDIENAHVLSTSKIFITPLSLTESPLVVTLKQVGIGFTVGTLEPSDHDVFFDWLLIDTYPTDLDTTSRPNETVVEDIPEMPDETPDETPDPDPIPPEPLPDPEPEVVLEPVPDPVPEETTPTEVPPEAALDPEPEPPSTEPEPTPEEDPAPEGEQE